ncbi:MAG: hypothetical protein AB1584_20955 [Pseudomonadota bacterium]
MQNETLYRCIQPGCARTWPRRVNFCPYCGTAQGTEVARGDAAAHRVPPAAQEAAAAAPAAPAAPASAAPDGAGIRLGKAGREDADAPPRGSAATTAAPAAAAALAKAQGAVNGAAAALGRPPGPVAAAAPPAPPAKPPPTPPPTPASPPRPGVRFGAASRAGPAADAPPKRQPVRLRWWLLALALLWVVWLVANPAKRRIEKQMDKAIALATACKPHEAQSELIALRSTKATPEQLQHVQQVLNEAAGECTRKRQRDKAWREAKAAVESALASSSFERARTRLRTFTKRWGEDEASRDLKAKIDARQPEHPRADEVR